MLSEISCFLERESFSSHDTGLMKVSHKLGVDAGKRIASRLTFDVAHLSDAKDVMKFLCKEFWSYVYGQQASRLQANKKGVFVVYDSNFPPIQTLARSCISGTKAASVLSHSLGPLQHPMLVGGPQLIEADESPTTTRSITHAGRQHSPIQSKALCKLDVSAGILRGFLEAVGFTCRVEASVQGALPACAFTICHIQPSSEVLNPSRLLNALDSHETGRT
jgi:hypothetical protein